MSQSNPPLWWSKPSTISRYTIAVLSIAIPLVVALCFDSLHTEPIVSLFLCAVMFVAWFGGFGPGLFATALALLAFYYYLMPPINSFTVKFNSFSPELKDLPRIVVFSIVALFVNFLSAAQRQTAESLRRSRDDLLAAIEDQRRIEGALLHSEMHLAEAQRLSHTGSFGWRVSSGEIFWSEQSFRIFGYAKAPSATIDMVLQRVHPEDLALVQRIIDRAASDRKNFDFEHRLLMPDGSVKYVHVVAHAVRDRVDQLEFIGALMDVTAAKRAGEALHKAQSDLAHVTRVTTLGELTASIAHEVNQPLAAVVTNAEACLRWLDRESPNLDEARGAVRWIIKDGRRAAEVIQRVRALASKAEPHRTPLDIDDVTREMLALSRGEFQRHGIALRADLSAGNWPVLGDRVQLQQVLLNLIMNGVEAMKAVAEHPRELMVSSTLTEQGSVLVAVEDTGAGLDSAVAERIFEPFFTTKSNGLGMGLSICRSIIEAHGGRLWASPRSPRGAVFQFTVPTAAKEEG